MWFQRAVRIAAGSSLACVDGVLGPSSADCSRGQRWRLVARSGAYRLATVLWAAVTGAVLGIVTGAVAIAAGIRPMRANGYPSVAPDPTMLSDPSVRWCVLASLACFPLWTLIGVAIGRLLRRARCSPSSWRFLPTRHA